MKKRRGSPFGELLRSSRLFFYSPFLPAHGAGAEMPHLGHGTGDAAPTFLWIAPKEKPPQQRWKRNRFWVQILPFRQVWTNTGVERDGAVETWRACAGCAIPLGSRESNAHIWGLGAAFGVVVVWVLPLAPRVPLRYVLPGRITGAAAEGDADQVRFAARHTETVHRGVRVYKFQQSRSRAQR